MAGSSASVKVKGLRELRSAIKRVDDDLSREVDQELLGIAGEVAGDAARRFRATSARSAAGFKPKARGFGRVTVVQTVRSKKVRPQFGAIQMRDALIPAVWSKADDTERALDRMVGRLANRNGF